MTDISYPFKMRPLTEEEGGGYLIEFPDLPGCISDGETVEEAINNGNDAVRSWIACAKEHGDPIPLPGSHSIKSNFSGKFVQRVPKTIHKQLAERAEKENVSLNSLVLSYISQGLSGSNHA